MPMVTRPSIGCDRVHDGAEQIPVERFEPVPHTCAEGEDTSFLEMEFVCIFIFLNVKDPMTQENGSHTVMGVDVGVRSL